MWEAKAEDGKCVLPWSELAQDWEGHGFQVGEIVDPDHLEKRQSRKGEVVSSA